MRIVHVVETLERGGLERMVCDLAAEQARRGDTVQVLCVFRRGLLADELERAGVPVHAAGKRGGALNALAALWRLRTLLRAARAEVIHTHNATAHYHVVGALLGASAAPVISTRHGMGAARDDARERWYRRTHARTARVVGVCRHAAERLVADGIAPRATTTVIPNGIHVERFAGGDRAAARQAMGVDADAPVAGIVGRLNWAKDHRLLLDAFARVHARLPAARLVIVGDGELRGQIESQRASLGLQAVVTLLGDRSDVPALLPGFDAFVLSSRTEGYSIALLEAAAAGLPIVATDVGGNREIVADGRTGRLVPHGDPVALADALLQVLGDPARRAAWSFAARAWAREVASVGAMASSYARLYRECLIRPAEGPDR